MELFKIMPTRQKGLEDAHQGLKRSGESLVSYANDSGFTPSGFTDDIGIYWAIPKVATFLDISTALAANLFFLSIILISFLIFSLGFIKLFRGTKERFLALSFSAGLSVLFFLKFDVYIFYFFSISFIPLILYYIKNYHKTGKPYLIIAIILISSLGWYSNVFRTHSGTTLIIFLISSISFLLKEKITFKAIYITLIIITLLLPKYHFNSLISSRDSFILKENPKAYNDQNQHVIWHSIYIGLGYLSNQYVAEYRDEEAIKKVASVSKEIKYCSIEYENTLKDAVFEIFDKSPLLIIKIYLLKISVIIGFLLFFLSPGIYVYFTKRNNFNLALPIPFILSIGFSILPGILVVPRLGYLSSALSIAAVLSLIIFLDKEGEIIEA